MSDDGKHGYDSDHKLTIEQTGYVSRLVDVLVMTASCRCLGVSVRAVEGECS
jgi:hypothetical protein